MAIKNNIKILSWTYNDPAVWYEFVIDTAKKPKNMELKACLKALIIFLRKQ